MDKRAFTLIELLTVIAIIGILAGILIPTVGKVRASARNSKCMANLRQIGVASNLYAAENKTFPTTTANIPWPNRLLPYFSSQTLRLSNNTVSNLYAPIDVVMCPSITIPPPPDAVGFPRSYSANPRIIFSSSAAANANRAPVRPAAIPRPSGVVLFADACQSQSTTGNTGSSLDNLSISDAPTEAKTLLADGPDADGIANSGHLRFRHGGRVQTVFVDGSVQTFGKSVLTNSHFSIAY